MMLACKPYSLCDYGPYGYLNQPSRHNKQKVGKNLAEAMFLFSKGKERLCIAKHKKTAR